MERRHTPAVPLFEFPYFSLRVMRFRACSGSRTPSPGKGEVTRPAGVVDRSVRFENRTAFHGANWDIRGTTVVKECAVVMSRTLEERRLERGRGDGLSKSTIWAL